MISNDPVSHMSQATYMHKVQQLSCFDMYMMYV